MPLSAAEKMRRYRERLKNENPEKYEEQRKKNLERIKSKKKKVSEMDSTEKAVQRQNWRRYQTKCRKKKLNDQKEREEEKMERHQLQSNDSEKIIKKLNIKYKILQNKFRRHLNYLQKVNKLKEKYKKRYQRIKAESTKKINMMEDTLNKMKAREEVLEHTLKNTYRNCKKHYDKRLFKQLIYNSRNKAYVAKLIGLKNGYFKGKKKTIGIRIIQEIRSFYMRDDVSRNTAGKKQTKTKQKDKKQIRYLLDSLVNLYKKYKKEGGRYGFTTFYKQKPFFVLSPHIHCRETCACIKHSNFNFLFVALKQRGILKHDKHSEFLNQLVCNTGNYSCMYSDCKSCAGREIEITDSYQAEKNKLATWYQWERKDHTYFKSNNNDQQLIKTKKTVKSTKTGTIEELLKTFESSIKLYKKHHYNMLKQLKEYQNAVATLKENEALIVCDFSENYEAKLSEEIQSMHFGASKSQITLHTGMIYWKNMSQSFCSISDSNSHQPPAIWAHLTPILDLIKENSPDVNVIHFFSDGPTSQYRQKNNFYLLTHFTKQYNLQSSSWSFFESGHGKSVADGIGGCIKRILDKKICYGFDITNAVDAYTILQSTVKNVKVFLIEEGNITKVAEILPNGLIPLKGTMNLHQVITTTETNTIKYRDVSCFCEPARGECKCFSPQNHTILLQPNYNDDKENVAIPSTSKINTRLFKRNSDKLPLTIIATDNQDTAQLRDFIDMYSAEGDCISISNDCSQNERESDLMNIELLPLISLPDKEPNSDQEDKLNITKDGAKCISTKAFLECHECSCSILGKIIRCLACKNVYCDDCVKGPTYFDYICDACFADEGINSNNIFFIDSSVYANI